MFFRDYVKETITYDAAQFAIAIALDNLNDVEAARKVLSFLCPSDAVGKEARQLVLQKREELQEKVSSSRKGAVWTTLNYYYNTKVFKVRGRQSRTSNTETLASLSEMTKSSQKAIYEETMRILIKHPVNSLIHIYTKTSMFTKEFIRFVKIDGAKNNRNGSGAVSDSVARELLAGFSQFVYENCSSGAYYPSSCTPNAFLFAKKATTGKAELRPIDWFKLSDGGKYFKVLNRTGTNTTVGEDLTLLDQVDVDLSKKEYEISFILTCEKISKASALLFTHLDEVYFDILSYHRKIEAKALEKRFNSLGIIGCNFSYGCDLSSICNEKENLISKFNSRCGVCERFEQILVDGIQLKYVKDLYYDVLMYSKNICAGPSGTKDAKSLFSFNGYNSREPGTNGLKFLTLLEGYSAMKDLINFLQSDSNTRDVGVADFPCDIFRQPLLLKRFKTYEDYIDYIDEIRPLVEEVESDSDRRNVYSGGLYSNDYVYDVLENSQLIKQDLTLRAIAASPLESIQNAVDLFENAGKDAEFIQNINDSCGYWDSCVICFNTFIGSLGLKRGSDIFNISIVQEADPVALMKTSITLCKWILTIRNDSLISARHTLINYMYVAALSTVLRALSRQFHDEEGMAIASVSGYYELEGVGLAESLALPDELVEALPEAMVQKILVLRGQAIKTAIHFLWGDAEQPYPELNELDTNWVELRNFWFVTTKLARYMVMNTPVAALVYSDTEDLALLKIETIDSMPLLKLTVEQTEPTKISDFAILRTPCDPEYTLPFVSREEARALQNSLSAVFCESFKNFFSSLKIMRQTYASLIARSTATFSKLQDLAGAGTALERRLSDASQNILQVVMSGGARPALEQKLAAIADFDDIGFARTRTKRFVYGENTYIHEKGYAIQLRPGNMFEVLEITEDMLFRLRSSLM